MYMNVQLPLPVNSNPGMVFPPKEFSHLRDMARFGAVLIDGVLQHKDKLDRSVYVTCKRRKKKGFHYHENRV